MSDMPERIWVPMGDGRFGQPADCVYTEAVKGSTKYIRADKYAELEAELEGHKRRIGTLVDLNDRAEAQNKRLEDANRGLLGMSRHPKDAEKIRQLEEQNKWISVDERLPEEGQFCVFYYGIIDGEPEMDADFWEESSMTMGYSWQRNVTHWKPITPPEKDDE